MHHLDQILIVLGCGCVLPIMVVWLIIRESMNKTNQRTQIVLAAIEKNPDMEDFAKEEVVEGETALETVVGWYYRFPGYCPFRVLHCSRLCWWYAYSSSSTIQPFRRSSTGHRYCFPYQLLCW